MSPPSRRTTSSFRTQPAGVGAEPPPQRADAIAATVIRWSNRESPADQVLRAELKKARGLRRETGRLASEMVFAYYRWLGWLSPDQPIETNIHQALDLQSRFNHNPGSVPDEELVAKAVAPWTKDVMEVTPAWVRSLQAEPVLWIRAIPGLGESLARQLSEARPGPLPDSLAFTGEEDLFVHPEFQNGTFEIQDLSSQMVGHVCAPKPRETWWDACAGEGGKTMHLSALMGNKGLIWASDRAEWRLTRLKRRAARAKVFNYRTVVWDGGERPPTKTLFDGVLVDAPCSGLGTWQRNPHARWTVRREDISELAALQASLLERTSRSVKPGGRLIYSVCTLAREETSVVANGFTANHPDFVPERPIAPWLPTADGPEPWLWIWPQHWKANGMFIAQWRKR